MRRLELDAADSFRTPDQHALWLLSRALPAPGARRIVVHDHIRVPVTPSATQLIEAIGMLVAHADHPSSRKIEALVAAAGGDVSHTTINEALRWNEVANWRVISAIVRGLGGDPLEYRPAWELAHAAGAGKLNGDDQRVDIR